MTSRPDSTAGPRVAVIGAGLAGSMCARTLRASGVRVTVVDKGRGPGGRCSTRRVQTTAGEISFDHGAQYFTIRDPAHARLLDDWLRSGVAAPWTAFVGTLERGTIGAEGRDRDGSARGSSGGVDGAPPPTRYVGTPGMNALVKALQQDLQVQFGCRVAAIEPEGRRWRLRAQIADGERPPGAAFDQRFDAVVVTAPPKQATALLDGVEPGLAASVAAARLAPCWATMVQFDRPLSFAGPHAVEQPAPGPVGGLFVRDSPLAWIANQCSRPGRRRRAHGGAEHWVLHASAEWSAAHLELDAHEVGVLLLEALADAAGEQPPPVRHQTTHRWRYASVASPGCASFLWSSRGLGVCGDWCVGGRVEGALASGRALADHLSKTGC